MLRTTQRAQDDWQLVECQNWDPKTAWRLEMLLRVTQSTQNGLEWAECQSGGPKADGEHPSCWPESPRVGTMAGSAQRARMRVLGGWLSGVVSRSGGDRLRIPEEDKAPSECPGVSSDKFGLVGPELCHLARSSLCKAVCPSNSCWTPLGSPPPQPPTPTSRSSPESHKSESSKVAPPPLCFWGGRGGHRGLGFILIERLTPPGGVSAASILSN